MRIQLQLLALLPALLAATQNAYARSSWYEEEVKTFTGGFAAGLNLAQVDGDLYFGYNKPGLSAGGFVRVHFNQQWSACGELLFSQKGSRGNAVIESPYMGTYVARCNIGLSYLEAPVTIQYDFGAFSLETGVSYAVLLKTNEWILAQQQPVISEVGNRFNSTDLDFIAGASRKLYKHWYLNVRFQYSLVPMRPYERIPAGYGWGTSGQFNNLFCVRLLYAL